MKILILVLSFVLFNAHAANVSNLRSIHVFSAMQSPQDFVNWCQKENLTYFEEYAKTISPSEFNKLRKIVPKILSNALRKFLIVENPVSVFNLALSQNPGDVESAINAIYVRAQNDLATYRPVQRAMFNYALIEGVIFTEDRTLNHYGRLQLILGPWQLDEKLIDYNFVKANFANLFVNMDDTLFEFNTHEQEIILKWYEKYEELTVTHYSGHNSKLLEIIFTELRDKFPPRRGTLDDFVQKLAFMDNEWWHASNTAVPGEIGPATELNGERSRSLVRRYGKEGTRVIFWPKENKHVDAMPVLGQVHFAINYDAKKRMRSIEILAKDKNGEIWPFLYEKVNVGQERAWLPVNTFGPRAMPVRQVCFNCHGDRRTGKLNFKPTFLNSEAEFRADGYYSDYIIKALQKL